MRVRYTATATVSGCLFEGNTSAGILVAHSGTQMGLTGTVVRDTKPNTSGYLGTGLAVLEGAEAMALMCLFQRNATSGVDAFDEGTALGLETCAVLDTQAGGMDVPTEHALEFQVFGDGILAAPGTSVDVASTVVLNNARSGLYYYEAGGTIDGSAIAGNLSYGLAMEQCAEDLAYEGRGNFIFGNALDLPAAKAAEVTTNPEGLPVPPIPEVAEVSFRPLGER